MENCSVEDVLYKLFPRMNDLVRHQLIRKLEGEEVHEECELKFLKRETIEGFHILKEIQVEKLMDYIQTKFCPKSAADVACEMQEKKLENNLRMKELQLKIEEERTKQKEEEDESRKFKSNKNICSNSIHDQNIQTKKPDSIEVLKQKNEFRKTEVEFLKQQQILNKLEQEKTIALQKLELDLKEKQVQLQGLSLQNQIENAKSYSEYVSSLWNTVNTCGKDTVTGIKNIFATGNTSSKVNVQHRTQMENYGQENDMLLPELGKEKITPSNSKKSEITFLTVCAMLPLVGAATGFVSPLASVPIVAVGCSALVYTTYKKNSAINLFIEIKETQDETCSEINLKKNV